MGNLLCCRTKENFEPSFANLAEIDPEIIPISMNSCEPVKYCLENILPESKFPEISLI